MDIEQIRTRFPAQKDCIHFLEAVRWSSNPVCPHCLSDGRTRTITPMPNENRHHCNMCGVTFSVTVRTVFHQTHIPLEKWFVALTFFLSARKVSGRKLAVVLNINRNTACSVLTKIKRAMSEKEQRDFLLRIVEELENSAAKDHL